MNHVTYRPGLFIVITAPLDSDRFGICDLNVIDILPIPERFPNAVGKTKYQQILHGLFAEIVIDTINLIFFEDQSEFRIEFQSALQIMSERLLNYDPRPAFLRLCYIGST